MSDTIPDNGAEKEKVYHGSISIFHKLVNGELRFLVVENSQTGNVTLVSGAAEEGDGSLEDSAKREIQEELGLESGQYTLQPTSVVHEFVFGPNKPKRAGLKGSYQVFLVDASSIEVEHTNELRSAAWMTEQEALHSLSFPDLQTVFEKAIKEIGP